MHFGIVNVILRQTHHTESSLTLKFCVRMGMLLESERDSQYRCQTLK